MTVKMLVAAEGSLMREAFVRLLSADPEIDVAGEASSGQEALESVRLLAPQVVLMDLSMQGMDGIETTRLIKAQAPDVKVILIGASTDEGAVVEAVRAGARGYVSKSTDGDALIALIKRTASGGVGLSDAMTAKLISALAVEQVTEDIPTAGPSAREREVLALVREGATNKAIAQVLKVSENTIRAHIRSLMQKLDAENRTQLAIYAMRNGIERESSARTRESMSPGARRPVMVSGASPRGILTPASTDALPTR
jgi:DNA-binding NarL/FixJ family response regulator